MMKTGIGFVLLVLYVPFSRGKTCQIRTTRYVVFKKRIEAACIGWLPHIVINNF